MYHRVITYRICNFVLHIWVFCSLWSNTVTSFNVHAWPPLSSYLLTSLAYLMSLWCRAVFLKQMALYHHLALWGIQDVKGLVWALYNECICMHKKKIKWKGYWKCFIVAWVCGEWTTLTFLFPNIVIYLCSPWHLLHELCTGNLVFNQIFHSVVTLQS